MSARYEQVCASSTGGVGDVGLCCTDLGPETCEADCGERCIRDTRAGAQSSIGWAFQEYSHLQYDRTSIALATLQKMPSATNGDPWCSPSDVGLTTISVSYPAPDGGTCQRPAAPRS